MPGIYGRSVLLHAGVTCHKWQQLYNNFPFELPLYEEGNWCCVSFFMLSKLDNKWLNNLELHGNESCVKGNEFRTSLPAHSLTVVLRLNVMSTLNAERFPNNSRSYSKTRKYPISISDGTIACNHDNNPFMYRLICCLPR